MQNSGFKFFAVIAFLMPSKKVIFTTTDSKYWSFTANHWLKSLRENCNLKDTDIVVLDYGTNPKNPEGLSAEKLAELKRQGIKIVKCKRTGHVTNIRYRDMLEFLNKNNYSQVLSIDGGDIIFQTDFSHCFMESPQEFRAVCEDTYMPFEDVFLKAFEKKAGKKIKETLKGKRMINAGVLFGPAGKFKKLCRECDEIMLKKKDFGPDQIAVNYFLYSNGFKELGKEYNFVITTSDIPFRIADSEFYFEDGKKIPIVHNAGNYQVLRTVRNFGYGKGRNVLKKRFFLIHGLLKIALPLSNFLKNAKKTI